MHYNFLNAAISLLRINCSIAESRGYGNVATFSHVVLKHVWSVRALGIKDPVSNLPCTRSEGGLDQQDL
jgi:hypothetical protein